MKSLIASFSSNLLINRFVLCSGKYRNGLIKMEIIKQKIKNM